MARVTVEDCVQQVPNRFQLVVLAAQRARDISAGGELTVDRDRDKNPVVALREIAEASVATDDLYESVIKGRQKVAPIEDLEDLDDTLLTSGDADADDDELDLAALARDAAEQGAPEPVNRDRLAEAYDAGEHTDI